MANNQFSIDRSKTWGMQLSNSRDQLNRALALLREVRGKMIQCYAPDNDWANVEAQFGLATGKGAACFAELDSTLGAIGHPDTNPSGQIDRTAVYAALTQFIDQVG